MSRLTRPLGLLLPLAIYFALALPQLTLPGLHNDEAVEAGLPAGQILSGQPVSAFRESGLSFGRRTFPLMVQDYIGALNVYTALPFFAALGPTVIALRLYTVLIGALTLGLTFGFVARVASRRAACIAALLLAASPSFIFWQRQGVFVTSLTATFMVGALWAGALWATCRSPETAWKWAALVGLLCGAGLYAKLLFIWVIGGMAGALAIINLPGLVRQVLAHSRRTTDDPHSTSVVHRRRRKSAASSIVLFPRTPTPTEAAAFSLSLLAALSPLFIFNLQTGGTLLSVGTNLTTSYYGVNNLNVVENLAVRIDHFRAVIAGRDHLWYLGGSFGNEMWESALNLAALVLAGRWLFRRQRSRLPAALLLLLALGLGQSSFTVSGLFPTHFAVFTPLWPILVALASETILDPFYEPMFLRLTGPNLSALLGNAAGGGWGFLNLGMAVVLFGLGTLFTRDAIVTVQYHAALQKSGGLGPHSDAVYRLIEMLETEAGRELGGPPYIAALDWGFAPQVKMLTGGGLQPDEIFGYTWEADEGFADRLNAALDQPNAFFVFHFPQETIFPRREQFDADVRERGWEAVQLAVIARRDGAPMFEILKVVRSNMPPVTPDPSP